MNHAVFILVSWATFSYKDIDSKNKILKKITNKDKRLILCIQIKLSNHFGSYVISINKIKQKMFTKFIPHQHKRLTASFDSQRARAAVDWVNYTRLREHASQIKQVLIS